MGEELGIDEVLYSPSLGVAPRHSMSLNLSWVSPRPKN